MFSRQQTMRYSNLLYGELPRELSVFEWVFQIPAWSFLEKNILSYSSCTFGIGSYWSKITCICRWCCFPVTSWTTVVFTPMLGCLLNLFLATVFFLIAALMLSLLLPRNLSARVITEKQKYMNVEISDQKLRLHKEREGLTKYVKADC